MTINEDINMNDLVVGGLYRGHHTKYVYEVLDWDGDLDNGGMAFVRRARKKGEYREYKLINIVDLLRAYDKLPALPQVGETWKNPYGRAVVVRVMLDDSQENSWVGYSDEGVMSVDEHATMPTLDFIQKFLKVGS